MSLITAKPAGSIWHLRDRATTLGDLHEFRFLRFFSAASHLRESETGVKVQEVDYL